jgi:dipeptidyl aminopeptidase/acylaminoacyl peptidase
MQAAPDSIPCMIVKPFPRPLLSAVCTATLLSLAGPLFAHAATADKASAPATPKNDPRIPQILASLNKVQNISQTAISPDGQHLAWVLRSTAGSEIMLGRPDGQDAQRVQLAAKNEHCSSSSIAFSPDSQKLAFLSDCASSAGEVKPGEGKVTQDDLFILPLNEKKAKQLSHLHGYVHEPAWSPDGKQIGVLYVEGATRPAGALDAMKPPSGVIGVEGLEVQRVAAIDAATGHATQITPEGLHVYEFDWSPDSTKLAYVAAPPPGENNWWVAKLYTQFIGSAPRPLLDPQSVHGPLHGLQIAVPRWSPDGSKIAFIGGLMSDQGATGGDAYLIPSIGGAPVNLTTGTKTSPAWLAWTGGNKLIVTGIDRGMSRVSEATLRVVPKGDASAPLEYRLEASFEEKSLFTLPENIGDGRLELGISIAKNDKATFVASSFDHAPEVYVTKLEAGATPTAVTHVNDTLKPSWGKSESITWTNEGFNVQGWLLLPADYDPAKKYPMIVMVHGGPSSAVLPRWPGVGFGGAPFSALGYFVLMPNPRGSYGEGEKFTQANVKDFGYGDLRDILAGVDAVEKKYPVDDKRLGLTGWSYGGFMTMFAVTQTNRFHAAVAGAGISDWQSYYGENSIDQWMIPFFGASVYDDPKIYAKSSAIDYIKQVKTPTLVVVGDRDGECPSPQSFEFWHALKAEHVPTELVVYPNEGHAFRLPEHRSDVLERALNWFQQYMGATDGNARVATGN